MCSADMTARLRPHESHKTTFFNYIFHILKLTLYTLTIYEQAWTLTRHYISPERASKLACSPVTSTRLSDLGVNPDNIHIVPKARVGLGVRVKGCLKVVLFPMFTYRQSIYSHPRFSTSSHEHVHIKRDAFAASDWWQTITSLPSAESNMFLKIANCC